MARRTSVKSINDVNLPAYLLKDMSMELLKTLDGQDEGTFYEFFQELQLGDVSVVKCASLVTACVVSYCIQHLLY